MAAEEHLDPEAGLTRRRLLLLAGSTGASLLAARAVLQGDGKPTPALDRSTRVAPTPTAGRAVTEPAPAGEATPGLARWSDPATWGGRVPGEHDVATVARSVQLDVDARVAGVTIPAGGALVFEPGRSRALETTGNVVVEGLLNMSPVSPAVVHRLVFAGIDEARFVGGGNAVLASDVGLWVMGEGVVDTAGSPKLAWARTEGAVPKGAREIRLDNEPLGWQVGDEIAITPTLGPEVEDHWEAYDTVTVTAINGRVVTLGAPTAFEHPAVAIGNGVVRTAEVLNLSRNVAIEGTATGRSHVFLLSTRSQTLRHTLLRHMGPRTGSGQGEFVPGRYAIHFHVAEDGPRGSVVEGAVGRDCGSHTFVTHFSHGVTWRDCITHDTLEEAYWWDPKAKETGTPAVPSNEVLYERCVASRMMIGSRRFRLAGFFLGAGTGSVARDCVAVGMEGSGYHWPSSSQGLWGFEDCLSHNNKADGIFVWQNTDRPHVIKRFTCYHNAGFGVNHGAYKNGYVYDDGILYGNGKGSVSVKALSQAGGQTLRFSGLACDAAGLTDYNVVIPDHVLATEQPAEFVGCSFRGHRVAAFGFTGEGKHGHRFDLVDNSYEGKEFWLGSEIPEDSLIRVQDPVRGSILLQRIDRPGAPNEAWQASVRPIPPFSTPS